MMMNQSLPTKRQLTGSTSNRALDTNAVANKVPLLARQIRRSITSVPATPHLSVDARRAPRVCVRASAGNESSAENKFMYGTVQSYSDDFSYVAGAEHPLITQLANLTVLLEKLNRAANVNDKVREYGTEPICCIYNSGFCLR